MDDDKDMVEAIAVAYWAFQELQTATTLPRQAAAYDKLANAMSDLASWHPDYSARTGDIGGYG